MSTLVIVESPLKPVPFVTMTGYRVEASMGHVRDLPPSADEILRLSRGKMGQFGVWTLTLNLYVVPKVVLTERSAESGRRTGASH